MKALRSLLMASLLGAACLAPAPAPAQITIDIDVFHERLSPYGRWDDDERFGEIWIPRRAHDWRPYSNGRWVFTDDYGWLWVEEDEWGWATEHYGRWLHDDDRGWFWVPGFEWAPAWVRWRGDDDYIGWAPLPPRGYERDWDDDRRWVFVESPRFVAPNVRTVLVERDRYDDLLRRVPRKGEVRRARRHWENRAIDDDWVERVARRPVPRVRVRDAARAQRARVEGDAVAVYRPEVRERDRGKGERRAEDARQGEREGKQQAERERADRMRAQQAEREQAERSKQQQAERAKAQQAERKAQQAERARAQEAERERKRQKVDRAKERPQAARTSQPQRERAEQQRPAQREKASPARDARASAAPRAEPKPPPQAKAAGKPKREGGEERGPSQPVRGKGGGEGKGRD